jgi:hypothetical protein
MIYLNLFEGFVRFDQWKKNIEKNTSVKETDVQKEINSPFITIKEIPNKINIYFEFKKTTITYRKLFKAFLDSNKSDYYYNKMIWNFEKICKILYIFSRVKDSLGDFDILKEFEFLSEFYCHREFQNILKNKDLISMMGNCTFYLNEIYNNLYEEEYSDDDVFYSELRNNDIKYKNRKKEEKNRIEHKEVDPLGEENWD